MLKVVVVDGESAGGGGGGGHVVGSIPAPIWFLE